jgi:hypothetical protein
LAPSVWQEPGACTVVPCCHCSVGPTEQAEEVLVDCIEGDIQGLGTSDDFAVAFETCINGLTMWSLPWQERHNTGHLRAPALLLRPPPPEQPLQAPGANPLVSCTATSTLYSLWTSQGALVSCPAHLPALYLGPRATLPHSSQGRTD